MFQIPQNDGSGDMDKIEQDFTQLYESYYMDILYFLLKWSHGDYSLAEELTQETFFQVFLSLHRYRGDCSIKTWICQIAKNVSYKYFSKRAKEIPWEQPLLEESRSIDSPEAVVFSREERNMLRRAMRRLKKKYRDVMIYRVYFELSFQEIGQILHISENSAKVIYYRGKEKLKSMLSSKI
ncbi:MAG: sigma-70 family RNA polymerase sigma factor [Lachnospiraceae bacterium]|nr:sigma-70 family RNA polymerase sigma factor [Lachnospiraceae bacterium]